MPKVWKEKKFFSTDFTNSTPPKKQRVSRQTKNKLTSKSSPPKQVEINWMEAENLVKNLPCSSGGTVDECLNKKAKIKAVEDLDRHVYPRKDGLEIERLMLLNRTRQLNYKWHVSFDGTVWVINGKAIGITKDKLPVYNN